MKTINCLNPSFTGTYLLRTIHFDEEFKDASLNPSFTGTYLLSEGKHRKRASGNGVLILLLLELTF